MKKKLVGLLAAFMLVAAFFVTSASPAHASTIVGGSLTCLSGLPVEGVWIDASSGSDGWASMNVPGNTSSTVSWHYTLTSGNTYYIHSGCGGTTQHWTTLVYSNQRTGNSGGLLCYDYTYGVPSQYQYKCA